MDIFERTKLLVGERAVRRLNNAGVLVFGLGGVGSYVCEALARAGVGRLGIVDYDTVAPSNINRQIIALHSTVGMPKTEAESLRLADINPRAVITPYFLRYDETSADKIDFSCYDYVVDAIDSVSGKLLIIQRCNELGIPVISCMGTGFKLDPSALRVADIFSTTVCPLAKIIRKKVRDLGIGRLKVVYSPEQPRIIRDPSEQSISADSEIAHDGGSLSVGSHEADSGICKATDAEQRKPIASISFVPSVAGLLLAGEVVKDLVRESPDQN